MVPCSLLPVRIILAMETGVHALSLTYLRVSPRTSLQRLYLPRAVNIFLVIPQEPERSGRLTRS